MTSNTPARLLTILLAAALAAGPVLAEKPEWAGQGKGKQERKHKDKDRGEDERRGDQRGDPREAPRVELRVGGYFTDAQRQAVRGYYGQSYGGAKSCPPGLAKKNNGCLPPGQAKKWSMGQPLPAGVVIYPVPQRVLVQLPPPPAGHKYVRVAADILLIAVGTQMVVDAIDDLMR